VATFLVFLQVRLAVFLRGVLGFFPFPPFAENKTNFPGMWWEGGLLTAGDDDERKIANSFKATRKWKPRNWNVELVWIVSFFAFSVVTAGRRGTGTTRTGYGATCFYGILQRNYLCLG
jgi:hypothetical protein